MADVVTTIEASERVLALPEPLQLGPMRIAQRHYTVVSVRCASGLSGNAYAQTRGAPVAEIVERMLAGVVVGRDAEDVEARWDELGRATVALGRGGLVTRAISLVDLALWDLRGRRAGVPVHALLRAADAAAGERVPVTYVAGYARDRGDVEAVVARALAAAGEGHRTVKVARSPEPPVARELHARLDAELPDGVELVVDANWAWRSLDEALAELRAWPAERIAWVEDPFVPEQPALLAELRRHAPQAIAAGDDLTDPVHVRRLLEHEAVDVLRLDVAAAGGITGVRPLVDEAAAAGVPVSFHISAESSIHLAAANPICRDVETFDRRGNPFDPSHELVVGGPSFAGGAAEPSPAPGLGFALAGEPEPAAVA